MSADDIDTGDTCPTEVPREVPHVWHASMQPAAVPALPPPGQTEVGRAALAALRQVAQCGTRQVRAGQVEAPHVAWTDVPQLYRRMIATAAGVQETVGKRDRELTEREKVLMRSALADMREWFFSLDL